MKSLTKKTKVKLTGTSDNVFALLAKCTKALKNDSKYEQAKELSEKVWDAKNYSEALCIMGKYCDIS